MKDCEIATKIENLRCHNICSYIGFSVFAHKNKYFESVFIKKFQVKKSKRKFFQIVLFLWKENPTLYNSAIPYFFFSSFLFFFSSFLANFSKNKEENLNSLSKRIGDAPRKLYRFKNCISVRMMDLDSYFFNFLKNSNYYDLCSLIIKITQKIIKKSLTCFGASDEKI